MQSTLATAPPEGWGLDAFLDTIEDELNRLGIAATAPDRRTVRYYATIGVLDRPTMAGREARYGVRHLAQVLALKKLQAAGVRLNAITAQIEGATTEDLAGLATTSPSPPVPPRPIAAEPATVRTQSVLTLAPGVQLVLDNATLSPTEAAALTKAAAALLTRITALGIIDKE